MVVSKAWKANASLVDHVDRSVKKGIQTTYLHTVDVRNPSVLNIMHI